MMTGKHKGAEIKINNRVVSLKLHNKFHNDVVQKEEVAQFVLSQEDHVSSRGRMTVQRRCRQHDGEKWDPAVTRKQQPSFADRRANSVESQKKSHG